MSDLFRQTGAAFSPDRVYRYSLWREWDRPKGLVNFVMLNPSTADEDVNDPTVERCERFARRWGYGGLYVTNLYAFRSTDPKRLRSCEDPVGPENDSAIAQVAHRCEVVVGAWGNNATVTRAREVLDLIGVHRVFCLDVNLSGHPVHPLYQPNDAKLVPFLDRWPA